MRRRQRRQLIVATTVFAAIAAAGAVMAAGVRAVSTWQRHHAETLLAEQLQTTSGIGQRLLSDSAAQLERVAGLLVGALFAKPMSAEPFLEFVRRQGRE